MSENWCINLYFIKICNNSNWVDSYDFLKKWYKNLLCVNVSLSDIMCIKLGMNYIFNKAEK